MMPKRKMPDAPLEFPIPGKLPEIIEPVDPDVPEAPEESPGILPADAPVEIPPVEMPPPATDTK